MTGETLTCPYCNASLAAPAAHAVGQSIVCPRCGDSFAWRSADALTNPHSAMRETVFADPPTTAGSTTAAIPDASPSVRRSNRVVASLLIVLMLFMAGSGLTFMLMTQSQRRAQDTSRPPRRPGKQPAVPELDEPPVVASVAPDQWEALGYLPSGVNLLAGVRVAELLNHSIGVRVLHDPLKVGGGERPLSDLPAWVGLRLEDIDHLVLGVRLEDALIPPFYLVLRTARPYDDERLRQRLKGTRTASIRKKNLYAFHTLRQDVPMAVWFADERTLVLALFADQLEALPNRPGEGLQRFSEEIRTVLKERLEPRAPIWLVGHSPDWSKTSAAKFSTRLTKDDWLKLSPLRTFGVWFIPDRALAVKGVFACTNEAGARGLDDYFGALHGPDADFQTARDGLWLTLQLQTGSDFLARWMKH